MIPAPGQWVAYTLVVAWHLRLFGVPMAEREDQLLTISLDKPSSLLFYLAERGDWVSRSELAYLYRPDVPESLALSTVRKLLHRAAISIGRKIVVSEEADRRALLRVGQGDPSKLQAEPQLTGFGCNVRSTGRIM